MAWRERARRPIAGLLGLIVATATILVFPVGSGAQSLRGLLDPSFGHGGRAFSRLGASFAASEFTSMARQPNGKLVLTGWVESKGRFEGEYDGIVERRGPTGELDPSFGSGGVVAVHKVGPLGRIDNLAVQDDGKVLFGDSQDGCTSSATVHRLQPDGAPDPSFGSGGVSPTVPLTVRRIALDTGGRILLAGAVHGFHCGKNGGPPAELAVARLLPNGNLDPGFGKGGVVLLGGGGAGSDAVGLAVREDGTVLAAGFDSLVALLPDGALDPGFGEGGVVDAKGGWALLAVPGNEAVLASSSSFACCPGPGDFILSRYRSDGSFDPGFGDGGRASLNVGAIDEASALGLAPDGSIVLAGDTAAEASCGGDCDFTPILARFTPAGAIDSSFGQGGWTDVETMAPPGFVKGAHIAALTAGPSGQILAVGGAGRFSNAFVAARLPDGKPDPSFGAGGAVREVRTLPSSSEAAGVAVEPGGGILASAWSDVGVHGGRAVLLGFRSNGHPDLRVGSGSGFSPTGAGGAARIGGEHWAYMMRPTFGTERGYVARFDPLGRGDLAYGTDGAAYLPTGFVAFSFLARPDGRVLVLGRNARRRGMAAIQLTPGGDVDRGFGSGGVASVGFGRKVKAAVEAAEVDSRGRIVLVGRAGPRAAVARLLADGSLDRHFARRGRHRWTFPYRLGKSALALEGGGGILVAISSEAGKVGSVTLRRLDRDGARDRSFGYGGVLRIRHGGTSLLSVLAGQRQIVVAVGRGASGEGGVALRAYHPNGKVDRGFGRGGVARGATSRKHVFRPVAVTQQPNGRIVVAGTAGKLEELGARIELLRFR